MNFLAGDSEIHHTDDFFKLLLLGLKMSWIYTIFELNEIYYMYESLLHVWKLNLNSLSWRIQFVKQKSFQMIPNSNQFAGNWTLKFF